MNAKSRNTLTANDVIDLHEEAYKTEAYLYRRGEKDNIKAADWWNELIEAKQFGDIIGMVTANDVLRAHESLLVAFKILNCISLCPLPISECSSDYAKSNWTGMRAVRLLPSELIQSIVENYQRCSEYSRVDVLIAIQLLQKVNGWMGHICNPMARLLKTDMDKAIEPANIKKNDENARSALSDILTGIAFTAGYLYGSSSESASGIRYAVLERIGKFIGTRMPNPFKHDDIAVVA
jgi:hypothetical protein